MHSRRTRRTFLQKTGTLLGGIALSGAPAVTLAGTQNMRRSPLPPGMNPLGVALVGLGNYATNQLAPALQETEQCRLTGIVTGTPAKAELARAHGCDHVIIYTQENVAERVRELTGGAGLPVVYDSVGQATFAASLDCLRPRGLMVSFGNASGPVTGFNPAQLAVKGSLYLTRPTLATHIATRDQLETTTGDLFDVVSRGIVKVEINQTYPLSDAAQAHRDLEARRTTGSTVLLTGDA